MTDPNAALAQLLAIHTQRTTEALTAIHSTVERIADALDDRAAAALAPAAVFGAKPSDVAEVYAMEKRIRDEIIREMADADALASKPPSPQQEATNIIRKALDVSLPSFEDRNGITVTVGDTCLYLPTGDLCTVRDVTQDGDAGVTWLTADGGTDLGVHGTVKWRQLQWRPKAGAMASAPGTPTPSNAPAIRLTRHDGKGCPVRYFDRVLVVMRDRSVAIVTGAAWTNRGDPADIIAYARLDDPTTITL